MKKSIFLLACLIGMASCTDHKDVFDPNAEAEKKKEEYDKNFPVTDIDPEQDWSTFRSVKVQVVVNETAGEIYTIKIYTENPLKADSNALLLAKGDVRNGETFTSNVELPKGLSGIYAARIDSKGACLVKYASVNDNGISSVSFGTVARAARSVQAGGMDLSDLLEKCPYTEEEINGFLEKATEFSGKEMGNLNDAYYKVSRDYGLVYHPQSDGKTVIIVPRGVTLRTNGMQIGRGCTVVLLGTLEVGSECLFDGNAKLIVFAGGKVNGASLNFTNSQPGILGFYNAGDVSLTATLTVEGQRFYNCGNVEVKHLQCASAQGEVVNNGHLHAQTADFSTSDIYALCYTHIGTFTDAAGQEKEFKTCYVADNAYLEVDNTLRAGASAYIYLGNNSMLSAGVYYYNKNKIVAPESVENQAYIKIGGVTGWWDDGASSGYYTIDVNYSSLDEWTKNVLKRDLLGHGTSREGQFTEATLTFTEPESTDDCLGDKIINGEPGGNALNYAYYAFEDLGTVGDYDFNDVVLKVSHVSGSPEATVELVAAGGTLATAVKYGEKVLWEEVHAAFGVDPSTMVNTGRGNTIQNPAIETITVPSNASFKELNFTIVVTYSNGNSINIVESVPSVGSAPQFLCVPGEWKWPKENISITQAYATEGHTFEEWARNPEEATDDWYKFPIADKVVVK